MVEVSTPSRGNLLMDLLWSARTIVAPDGIDFGPMPLYDLSRTGVTRRQPIRRPIDTASHLSRHLLG